MIGLAMYLDRRFRQVREECKSHRLYDCFFICMCYLDSYSVVLYCGGSLVDVDSLKIAWLAIAMLCYGLSKR